MPINVKTTAAIKALGKARDKNGKNIAITLEKVAQIALKESLRLVPKDTLQLEKSATVETTGKGFGATAMLVYSSPYAWQVHEDPSKQHEPPTQFKYVTQAIRNRRGTMTAALKRQMNVKMEGK